MNLNQIGGYREGVGYHVRQRHGEGAVHGDGDEYVSSSATPTL